MPEELHSTSEGRGFESRPAANKLLWQDSSGVEHRKRISPTPSCLLYHPFSGTTDRCLGKLQLIRVSQVRILPRSKRVAQLVEHRPFPEKPSCPPYPPFYGGRRMPEGITLTFHVKKTVSLQILAATPPPIRGRLNSSSGYPKPTTRKEMKNGQHHLVPIT